MGPRKKKNVEKFQTSVQYQPGWVPESIEMPPNKNHDRKLIPKIPGFHIPRFHDSRILGRMADFHFIYYIPIKTYNYIISNYLKLDTYQIHTYILGYLKVHCG